jgi:hypothetical protein
VGGGDHPDIDLFLALAADRIKGPVIEDRQQFDLQRQGHIANLGEKDRPFVGQFEHPGFIAHRPGEGTLDMAEQLRFQQVRRQGTTIDLDKLEFAPGELRWMVSAILSLPVPVSPVIRIEASVRAISGMISKTACIFGLWPMISVVGCRAERCCPFAGNSTDILDNQQDSLCLAARRARVRSTGKGKPHRNLLATTVDNVPFNRGCLPVSATS